MFILNSVIIPMAIFPEDGEMKAVSFNLNSVDFEGKKGLKLKLNSAVNDEVEITFNIKETMSVPEGVLNLDYSEIWKPIGEIKSYVSFN